MELANDGPQEVVVPTGLAIGKPFVRPEKSLSGEELLHASKQVSATNHVRFLTASGETVDSEDVDAGTQYPVAVVLPYTKEIGILKPGPAIDLHQVPSRRNGYEKEHVVWESEEDYAKQRPTKVILKRTRGEITIPEGYVGVIREQGLPGQVPHSRSTVLDSDPEHRWPIIGEHPLRTAGENNVNPTGFVMDMYRVEE